MAIFWHQNNNNALYQFLEKYCNYKITLLLVIKTDKNVSSGVPSTCICCSYNDYMKTEWGSVHIQFNLSLKCLEQQSELAYCTHINY